MRGLKPITGYSYIPATAPLMGSGSIICSGIVTILFILNPLLFSVLKYTTF